MPGVNARQKLLVVPGFQDRAPFDHVDHVGPRNGVQLVGDDEGRAALDSPSRRSIRSLALPIYQAQRLGLPRASISIVLSGLDTGSL